MAVYKKMIDEAVGATKSVFGVIKEKRGGTFKLTDAKPYVDAVNKMEPGDGQSKEVIDLHVQSVNAHYNRKEERMVSQRNSYRRKEA